MILFNNRMWWPKRVWQKHGAEGFELQSSELWGSKNDLTAQFQFQLAGFETKSVPFFFLKVFPLKNKMAFICRILEKGAVGSTKGCACVCYDKMQCMTKIIQKLGHHASNLCFVTLWVEGTLSMDSLNLGETWLLDKVQEPSRMGYV